MRVAKAIHSMAKLAQIVISGTVHITGALLRGDTHRAADLTRVLMWTVHQDFLLALVAAQRLLISAPPRDVDRVLVIKLDRIGDMVNTTPVFEYLRVFRSPRHRWAHFAGGHRHRYSTGIAFSEQIGFRLFARNRRGPPISHWLERCRRDDELPIRHPRVIAHCDLTPESDHHSSGNSGLLDQVIRIM